MRNCAVRPEEGYEDIPFLLGDKLREVRLENVLLDGYSDPRAVCGNRDGALTVTNGTSIRNADDEYQGIPYGFHG